MVFVICDVTYMIHMYIFRVVYFHTGYSVYDAMICFPMIFIGHDTSLQYPKTAYGMLGVFRCFPRVGQDVLSSGKLGWKWSNSTLSGTVLCFS